VEVVHPQAQEERAHPRNPGTIIKKSAVLRRRDPDPPEPIKRSEPDRKHDKQHQHNNVAHQRLVAGPVQIIQTVPNNLSGVD
jgi:hypothetical protein